MHPLGNRVMLRRLDESSSVSAAGFTIPDAAKERATRCEVVAIPSQPYMTEYGVVIACPVSPKDIVLIGKYSGNDHKLRGEDGKTQEVLFVRWDEILAVELAARFPDMPKVPDEVWQEHRHLTNAQESLCGATGARPPVPISSSTPTPDPAAEQYAADFARQLAARASGPASAVHPRATAGATHPNAKESAK